MPTAADPANWRTPRAKIGALSRSRKPDDPDLLAARRDMRAARAAEYIRGVVAAAPPLTEAQRATLAAMLAPAEDGGPVAA